ncbi:hypothetical protein ABAC460_10485 [Asticcacaulis sp. AC460]|nr:hypothetical protein ABAC460_10485 [Asticcacaulis sp. AC460]
MSVLRQVVYRAGAESHNAGDGIFAGHFIRDLWLRLITSETVQKTHLISWNRNFESLQRKEFAMVP